MTALPAESPFVIRAPRARGLRDAQSIIDAARSDAARILADAEAGRDAIQAEARAAGLAQAAAETAPLAAAAAAAIARFWAERQGELGDLALAVAHRVLSSLPNDDLLIRLARDAVGEHARDTRLALRVSPDLIDHFRAALDAKPFGDHVTLVADPDFASGECALLHPRGRTELGLLAQFRAMTASPAFQARIPA